MAHKFTVGIVEIEKKGPGKIGTLIAFRNHHGGFTARVRIAQDGKEPLDFFVDRDGSKSTDLAFGTYNLEVTTLMDDVPRGHTAKMQLVCAANGLVSITTPSAEQAGSKRELGERPQVVPTRH